MIILITGSSGFVGKLLSCRLEELGHTIIAADLDNGVDITDWGNLKKIPSFDLLIHLAARSYVPDSFNSPRELMTVNINGTLNALELCRKHKARMIFVSTYVYGKPEYLPVDEFHGIKPSNPYTQSKVLSEDLCKAYNRDFDLQVTIVRPFNIFGPGQKGQFLIPTILEKVTKKEIVLNDPRPRRDFLHIEDFVELLISTVNAELPTIDVINAGSGLSYSVKEVTDLILSLKGLDVPVKYLNRFRPGEVMETVADISKAKEILGWEPKITFEQGIRSLLGI